MKAIALANRLCRDLSEKSLSDLTADVSLEILDAINGAIQKMDAIAPFETKTTVASLALDAPLIVSIGVTDASATITGTTFTDDQLGRTIKIDGDGIENQIVGPTSLLHPYSGTTGTVSATIYSDAIPLPEPYRALVNDPRILETNRELVNERRLTYRGKQVAEPHRYWMEANARNRTPSAPSIIRFDTLPGQAYRMQVEVELAPARVAFADLLESGTDIPIRVEYVENYLLPIARGLLTRSSLWRDKTEKASAKDEAQEAERKWSVLAPTTLATPDNRVGTAQGF